MKNKPVAALYARISPTPESGLGANYSIKSQLHEMREHAKRQGWTVVEEFVDNNISGATLDRPALNRLREMIRSKSIDVMLAYSLDRLVRGTVNSMLLWEECQKFGVAMEFANGKYEDSPEGKLAYGVQSIVAEYERLKFRERSARGRRQKVREGHTLMTTRSTPYGYRYVGKAEGSRGHLEVIPEHAATIRRIYETYRQGTSLHGLVRMLNEDGVPAPRGGLWTVVTIYQILEKSCYTGTVRTSVGLDVQVPAIIDKALQEQVLARRSESRALRSGRPCRNRYLLRAMLFCSVCGTRCCGVRKKAGGDYYTCSRTDPRTLRRNCGAKLIRKDEIERDVWNEIWSTLQNPDVLYRLVKREYQTLVKPAGNEKKTALQLERLRRRERRAVQILEDPDSPTPYEEQKAKLAAIRREIANVLAEQRRENFVEMPTRVTIASLCEEITRGEIDSYEERRAVLEALEVKARTNGDEVTIEGSLPLRSTDGGENCSNGEGRALAHRGCRSLCPALSGILPPLRSAG